MALIITLVIIVMLATGLLTYLITRRDFGPRWTAVLAVGAGVVVGACFLFTIYLAVACFFAAALAYVIVRALLRRPPLALATSLATYAVLAVGSFAMFSIGLDGL